MTVHLTRENVTQALTEILAEEGSDYVYPKVPVGRAVVDGHPTLVSCFYVQEGPEGPEPSCIIGRLLHKLGVPLDELAEHEGKGVTSLHYRGLFTLSNRDPLIHALTELQKAQDDGVPWGKALRRAGFRIEGNNS